MTIELISFSIILILMMFLFDWRVLEMEGRRASYFCRIWYAFAVTWLLIFALTAFVGGVYQRVDRLVEISEGIKNEANQNASYYGTVNDLVKDVNLLNKKVFRKKKWIIF